MKKGDDGMAKHFSKSTETRDELQLPMTKLKPSQAILTDTAIFHRGRGTGKLVETSEPVPNKNRF